MDVKSVFLNRYFEEEVYVKQPIGYVRKDQEHKLLKLKKSLYGLKQAPRAWNRRLMNIFKLMGSSNVHMNMPCIQRKKIM